MIMRQATVLFLILFFSWSWYGSVWAGGEAQLTVGSEYTSGTYGGEDKTEIWYVPTIATYTVGPWLLKVVIPYLQITGPGDITASNIPLANETTRHTASGLGDITGDVSYALYENPDSGVMFDLTGNIKFATADQDQGLGTGENDYALQGDLSKQFGNWWIFTGLGWRIMGSTAELPLQDTWYGDTGLSYKISSQTTGGVIYSYRGEIVDGGSKVSEATVFLTQEIGHNSKILCYLSQGFSAASPDLGGGIALSTQFY